MFKYERDHNLAPMSHRHISKKLLFVVSHKNIPLLVHGTKSVVQKQVNFAGFTLSELGYKVDCSITDAILCPDQVNRSVVILWPDKSAVL